MHVRAPRVHRADRGRRLRRVRGRVRALDREAARRGSTPSTSRRYSDAGITAYHAVKRVAHLVVPGATVGRARRRRRGARRAPAAARARLGRRDRRRSTRTRSAARWRRGSAPTRCSTAPRSSDAVRDLTDGRGADLVMDFVGTDQTHADGTGDAGARRHLLDRGLRRDGDGAVGGDGRQRAARSWRNLVGSWIDLWEVMQLHARGQADPQDRDAPAGRRQRRAGDAARGRDHRPRRPRTELEQWRGASMSITRSRAAAAADRRRVGAAPARARPSSAIDPYTGEVASTAAAASRDDARAAADAAAAAFGEWSATPPVRAPRAAAEGGRRC